MELISFDEIRNFWCNYLNLIPIAIDKKSVVFDLYALKIHGMHDLIRIGHKIRIHGHTKSHEFHQI